MSDAIPEQMRAVVVHGPDDYRLERRPVPEPGPDDLLLRVEAAGVCASDVKCFHGAAKFWGDEHRSQYVQPGVIPGHEFTGVVVAGQRAALEAREVSLGDRVVCEQIVPCGRCRCCQRGQYWMCEPHEMFGFRGHDGAMAEYVLVPGRARVHRISAELAPQHAALAEPLSCALHAVERADIQFEDTVVVAGCGAIGVGLIAGVRQKNPLRLIALDLNDDKLDLGRRCGADVVINVAREDAVARVKELTGGHGADVYLNGTGAAPAVEQGLHLLRRLGRYVEYSVFGTDVSVDWSIISDDKELTIAGAHLGPHCWPPAIKMLEDGSVPAAEICTHQVGLDRFAEGLDLVADSGGSSVKVSILPHS